jgi:hypothetical protein
MFYKSWTQKTIWDGRIIKKKLMEMQHKRRIAIVTHNVFFFKFFHSLDFSFQFNPFILSWFEIGLDDLFWLAWYEILVMSKISYDVELMFNLTK